MVKIIGIIKYTKNTTQDDVSRYTFSNLALCPTPTEIIGMCTEPKSTCTGSEKGMK